ncbi:MAG: hypothetical protein IKS55_04530 [Oscillospiraceae bacterium]|nr:hypothetical protein [Oscillospiraceae bacterium]
MKKAFLRVLCASADKVALQPILDALKGKGLQISDAEGSLKKGELLLAALSENFFADEEKQKSLLETLGAGAENVLPLKLDESEVPEALMNALYARNIISASGRDVDLIAERVLAAIPKKKSALPKILITGAVVLAGLAGFLVWRSSGTAVPEPTPTPEPTATPEPTVEIKIAVPKGMTAEDLEKIRDLVIIGDSLEWRSLEQISKNQGEFNEHADPQHVLDEYSIAYDSRQDDRAHWYSNDDGHEYELSDWNLDFLSCLPNLRSLSLVLVDANALPDLSALKALERVSLQECSIRDLSGLKGSGVIELSVSRCPVTDLSPLTDCERLRRLTVDLYRMDDVQVEVSNFCPKLQRLQMDNVRFAPGGDLSALAKDSSLKELLLNAVSITDLSLIGKAEALEELHLCNCSELRDISALENAEKLKFLRIENCPLINDFQPVSGCIMLEQIRLSNMQQLRDASFLQNMNRLRMIAFDNLSLRDMSFLESLKDNGPLNFTFSGNFTDYSGLAAIPRYSKLQFLPRTESNPSGDVSQIMSYLQNAMIDSLWLNECTNIDLSALPPVSRELTIQRGDIKDLTGLEGQGLSELVLYNCQQLTSLEGIQALNNLGQMGIDNGVLTVYGCPRLTDWSALESLPKLKELRLYGCYTLPAFDKLHLKSLHLESIEGLDNLDFVPAIDTDGKSMNSLELVDLNELQNLSPLRQVRINQLMVPPHLGDQAQELKDAGVVNSYEIAFPDGSWQPMDEAFTLLSLEELETLPKSLLQRVDRLQLVGDTVVSDQSGWIQEDWVDGEPIPYWFNPETEERIKIEAGSVTDVGIFSVLTGLRQLELYCQPLENLDGIQSLSSLESLRVEFCPNLRDASAAFALQDLCDMDLSRNPIESIQGVQNLNRLQYLNLFHTKVGDLSPLQDCDFREACDNGGFSLEIADLPTEDFSALSGIRLLRNFCPNNLDVSLWAPSLENTEIRDLSACNCFHDNESFAAFIAAHPELERLDIPWNDSVTDLTPVLSLEHLQYLCVSANMEQAMDAVRAANPHFEIEIRY